MDKTEIIKHNPFKNENNYLNLLELTLDNYLISDATFTSSKLLQVIGKRLIFQNCKFQACIFDSLDLSNCIFDHCTFSDCTWTACKFVACKFNNLIWKRCFIKHNQWFASQMDEVTFSVIYGQEGQSEGQNQEDGTEENTTQWSFVLS